MDTRLRSATRIHHLLARHLGAGIDVGAMLKREDYAREVLFVCDASDDAELHALAAQFRAAAAAAGTAPIPRDAAWSEDSSGFGVSAPPIVDAAERAARSQPRWYKPSTWFAALDA